VNLALPLYLFSEPYPPKYKTDSDYDVIMMGPVKAVPGKFSCWDKEHVNGPMTIGGIIKQYQDKFNVTLSMITCGTTMIYMSQKDREAKTPMQVYEDILEEKYPDYKDTMLLELAGEDAEEVDCIFPMLVYHIR